MPLSLIEFMVNLKNWEFDIGGQYKIDMNEASKIVDGIEEALYKIQYYEGGGLNE